MRRLLLFVIAFAACTACFAQQTNHVIQRGETFELIARRYNISVNQLLAANPGVDQCFTGMKLNLPTEAKMSSRIYTITPQDLLQIEEASGYLKSGNYKKAVSAYSKAIENNPSATLYFGRALSYYNREKYKSAINDFEMAMTRPDCSNEMKTKCEQLVNKARELREEQLARRNETWGGVAAFVVGAAAVTATAVMANNSSGSISYMPPSSANGFQRDTSLDYLLDPRLAMMQTQQQEYEEYDTFKKLLGANISLEEYRNLKMKANYYNPHANDYLLDPKLAAAQAQQQEYEEYENFKKLSGLDLTLDQYRMLKYSSDNQGMGMENYIYESDVKDNDKGNEYKGKYPPELYQTQYKRLEHLVESEFNSLTILGGKYENKAGNIKGYTGDMESWAVGSHARTYASYQIEMRRIRLEAAKYGVHIPESKWETIKVKGGY